MLDAVANQLSADIFMAMPNRSRWLIYGKLDSNPPIISEMGQFVFSEKVIEGFWLVRWFQKTDLAKQMQVIKAVQERFVNGQWQTEVSKILTFNEVMAGLPDALKTGAKVMLIPK
jgi:NADPH:quinone reductase-like Zn-dependent oxidoreductase